MIRKDLTILTIVIALLAMGSRANTLQGAGSPSLRTYNTGSKVQNRKPDSPRISSRQRRQERNAVYVDGPADQAPVERASWESPTLVGTAKSDNLLIPDGTPASDFAPGCSDCGGTGCGPSGCFTDECGSSGCGTARCGGCCGGGLWDHCSGLFGEFMYLRARDAEVVYASDVDGAVVPIPAPGNQVSPVSLVDPDFEPAYRFGFNRALNDCSSIRASYTKFESTTTNEVTASPGNFIIAHITHPGVVNAGANWLDARAQLGIDFELVDIDYRWLVRSGETHGVNLVGGVRYGRLEQQFGAMFEVNGDRSVDSNISFDGAGIRLGVEVERRQPCGGFVAYGRGYASFLAGEIRADYVQVSNAFGGGVEIDTGWEADRVITVLDLELGLGWSSPSGRLQVTSGYVVSAWLNTLQTDEFIDAVQANHFTDIGGDGMSFDGIVVRGELRF